MPGRHEVRGSNPLGSTSKSGAAPTQATDLAARRTDAGRRGAWRGGLGTLAFRHSRAGAHLARHPRRLARRSARCGAGGLLRWVRPARRTGALRTLAAGRTNRPRRVRALGLEGAVAGRRIAPPLEL